MQMLLLTYRQPPLLTYQPRPAPKKRRPSGAMARWEAEGELEHRSHELERATGRPHCPKCTTILSSGGWHCLACGHVNESDRLMELYATAERGEVGMGRPGTFTVTRANFWIPGVYGTVYLVCTWWPNDDRNEMPTVAVFGPFLRKRDAERLREKLWRSGSVDLEMWPDISQAHPRARRAAIVWAVEKWLAPTHVR